MNVELLNKFFQGDCSPEEVHTILVWINSDEGKRELEKKLREFQPGQESAEEINSELLLEKIKTRIESENSKTLGIGVSTEPILQETKKINKKWYKGLYRIAGVLSVLFALAFLWFKQINDNDNQEMDTSKKVEMITKSTPLGQKLKITLADGSHVHLNSGSKIVFPRHFKGNKREVQLEGEAFFDVARDEKKPFLVHTQSTTTQVLGTSFVIQDFKERKSTKVGVLTGKVKVTGKSASGDEIEDKSYFLLPMEAVSYYAEDGSMKKCKVSYDDMFAWKDNVISFKSSNFEEVTSVLRRWFGVQFELRKGFSSRKDFTGKFDNQSLDQILEGLSVTFGFKYKIKEDIVIIY
ncbi:FecR family protein [Echinicola sp. CAU 1574]|uniref:FecR family protein n=1 Tax=Echinicola arenosa TaxID=2774144 RepID=A0ABR9ASD9_9BACT|nr:FecR family protein [Echinicola arenosa]MBD8491286.1 FecR family protein [Echinicola arenosa]